MRYFDVPITTYGIFTFLTNCSLGSDWHRLGRMLGLNPDCLDDIGKFTNFDLTSRAEKVITTWARQTRGANTEGLRQGLDKMDRDILLITGQYNSRALIVKQCP